MNTPHGVVIDSRDRLWVVDHGNQLHRNPIFTNAADTGKPPYLIVRIWTGTEGQPGR